MILIGIYSHTVILLRCQCPASSIPQQFAVIPVFEVKTQLCHLILQCDNAVSLLYLQTL